MERRKFIVNTAAFCVGLSAASLIGCTSYRNVNSVLENSKLKIKKEDFLSDTWVVVRSEATKAPILLSRNQSGSYTAVHMLCTHKQCEIRPTGTILSCPCHGAEFAFSGKVLKEPAETDLQIFETTTDEHFIYISPK